MSLDNVSGGVPQQVGLLALNLLQCGDLMSVRSYVFSGISKVNFGSLICFFSRSIHPNVQTSMLTFRAHCEANKAFLSPHFASSSYTHTAHSGLGEAVQTLNNV